MRRQKLLRKQKMDTKQEVHRFIEHIVHEPLDCIYCMKALSLS